MIQMLLSQVLRNLIFINLSLLFHLPIFAESSLKGIKQNVQIIDPCATDVLKAYRVSSPPFLCSDPNINGFVFSVEGQGVSTGYYMMKANRNPLLIEYNNGTFHLELEVVMKTDITKEYLIEIDGDSKSINNPAFGLTPAQNYCSSTNTEGWIFYNRFTLKLSGKNANIGQLFIFESPQSNTHTFQIGQGANTWQATLGSGLWFDNANTQGGTATIKGDLQIALTPYECCHKSICVPYIITKKD
jgi:hypothetical protein